MGKGPSGAWERRPCGPGDASSCAVSQEVNRVLPSSVVIRPRFGQSHAGFRVWEIEGKRAQESRETWATPSPHRLRGQKTLAFMGPLPPRPALNSPVHPCELRVCPVRDSQEAKRTQTRRPLKLVEVPGAFGLVWGHRVARVSGQAELGRLAARDPAPSLLCFPP